MKPTLEISRTLIPPGFRAEFEMSVPSNFFSLKTLAQKLLAEVAAPALLHAGELRDLKGRDPNLLLLPETPQQLRPHGFELLFLNGTTKDTHSEDSRSEDEPDNVCWSYRLLTPFKEFEGVHHIRHSLEQQYQYLDRNTLLARLADDDTKVLRCRFGLDIFQSRHFWAMIGFIPTAVRTILIEADEQELHLKIIAAELKNRKESPLTLAAKFDLWVTVARLLKDIYNLDVADCYQAVA